MNQKLFELMYNHSKQNSLSSNMDFIDDFIETVVNFKGLHAYVKDVKIKKFLVKTDENGQKRIYRNFLAKYNNKEKAIYVYLENIERYFLNDKNIASLTSFEKALYFYYALGNVLLHELDHVKQAKEMNNNLNQSFEVNLLRICTAHIGSLALLAKDIGIEEYRLLNLSVKESASQMNEKYTKLYWYSPEERLADFNACKTMQEILSCESIKTRNLSKIERMKELKCKLRGYKKEIMNRKPYGDTMFSPTIAYLQDGREGKNTKFDIYTNQFIQDLYSSKHHFSLDERLKYGLMISENEFYRVSEEMKAKRR